LSAATSNNLEVKQFASKAGALNLTQLISAETD